MSVYEERIAQDEARIRSGIIDISNDVQSALQRAVRALLTADVGLANDTILGDLEINRRIRDVDHLCLLFVARHLPSAGHLRFVTAVRRLTVEVERIGDYAVTICRAAVSLSKTPPSLLLRDIELMADHAERVLSEAMKAFAENSAEKARGVRAMVGQTESTFHRAFINLTREGDKGDLSTNDLLALYMVLHRLGRVADQAKNICEETIFSATGETKPPKVYRILFVDEDNGLASRLAESIARRDFPASGRYRSAGVGAVRKLPESCLRFMGERGLPLPGAEPNKLVPLYDALSDYHVIVGIDVDLRERLEERPFHSVLLRWNSLPPGELAGAADGAAAGEDEDAVRARLERSYEVLQEAVRALMVALRGEAAN